MKATMAIWRTKPGVPAPMVERTNEGSNFADKQSASSIIDAATEPSADLGGKQRIGYVDRIDRAVISGWACDTRDLSRAVAIEAVASNGRRTVTIADTFRADVKDAGYGDGNHGFELDLESLNLKTETVIVRFLDNKQPITNEPISLDPRAALLTNELPARFVTAMQKAAADVTQRHDEMNENAGRRGS